MNRFFVSKESFRGDKIMLGKEHSHQLRDVLRLAEGEHIVILDNTGYEYDVVLTKVRRDQIVGQIAARRPAAGEPAVQTTLFQSQLSRDKFELVLQKCTEVGVTSFVPVITERSLVRETAIKPEKFSRWQRIITEAAEQSHRGRIPDLSPPVGFKEVLPNLRNFDLAIIGWELAEDTVGLREALHSSKANFPRTIALLIGPEGGFSDKEVVAAKENGAIPVTLGQRILRTETAAIVASALVLYELEQTNNKL
jgi:16S rRNA (uracil1498-N3)-methyltransferase